MAFKMKGSAFKQGGSGIQGTSGHRSALKQHNEESPIKDYKSGVKMKSPLEHSTADMAAMGIENPEGIAFAQHPNVQSDRYPMEDFVGSHDEKHAKGYTHTGEGDDVDVVWQPANIKKTEDPQVEAEAEAEANHIHHGVDHVHAPTQMKSPVKQQTVVEDQQALPFNPDAISNVPGYMQSKVTGGSDWTVHEDTPKEGRGIKYRGEGGRYHVYDPSKWKDSKRIHPGGEPVDFTKSMWDQKTQSWVPLQDFKLEKPEEGVADMTDLPPEEGQPFEGEAKQVEKKMPWWKRRRNR